MGSPSLTGQIEELALQFRRLDYWSTSRKIFALITLALMPLGLIALAASIQSAANSERERRIDLRTTVEDRAGRLGTALRIDAQVLMSAADALDRHADARVVCARLRGIFLSRLVLRSFTLFEDDGTTACSNSPTLPANPGHPLMATPPSVVIGDARLILTAYGRAARAVGIIRYSRSDLSRLLDVPPNAVAIDLQQPGAILAVKPEKPHDSSPEGIVVTPTGFGDLDVAMTFDHDGLGASQYLTILLPLLMWGAAALIGFLVVDRLLIRPLAALDKAVADHVAGTPFVSPVLRTPSMEIRSLGQSLTQSIDDLSVRSSELADALVRQTALTREVHHRVKNNLQVIASLISLHARAATSADALDAYASIQRRVDALAIVHRNHYAELDDQAGLDIKPLFSELSANLRATAPEGHEPRISIAIAPARLGQDAAVALAFLITELTELATFVDADAPIAVEVEQITPSSARLSFTSAALRTTEPLEARLDARYRRVIEGLARQIRSPLTIDGQIGQFSVVFPTA